MAKKSALKVTPCLLALLKPVMLAHKKNVLMDAANIENLYRYAVDLFNGIVKNDKNEFQGKFDYNVLLTPSLFIVYKKLSNDSPSEKEYEEFMTAISIFQMVFIDENIHLCGEIDSIDLILSKDGITWGFPVLENISDIQITVSNKLIRMFEGRFTKKVSDKYILDFLPTVYRFNPFKEEKGNMMRHIVTPILSVKKENEKILSILIEYCRNYNNQKGFNLDI